MISEPDGGDRARNSAASGGGYGPRPGSFARRRRRPGARNAGTGAWRN